MPFGIASWINKISLTEGHFSPNGPDWIRISQMIGLHEAFWSGWALIAIICAHLNRTSVNNRHVGDAAAGLEFCQMVIPCMYSKNWIVDNLKVNGSVLGASRAAAVKSPEIFLSLTENTKTSRILFSVFWTSRYVLVHHLNYRGMMGSDTAAICFEGLHNVEVTWKLIQSSGYFQHE